MTIYADVLFGLNTGINYLLLLGSARLGGGHIRRWRLLLSAGLGGLYAVAALLPELGFLNTAGMKAVVYICMLLCAFGWEQKTIRLGLLFLATAFAFCGVALLVAQVFGTGLLLIDGCAFYPVSGTALLLLAGTVYIISYLVFSRIGEHGGGEIVPAELSLDGRTIPLQALRDTGNTLKDPMTNEQVYVTDWWLAKRLLPGATLERQQFETPATLLPQLAAQCPEQRFRLVPYRAVGTGAGMLLALRCQVKLGGRQKPALVAFSPTPVSDGGRFEMVIGGSV